MSPANRLPVSSGKSVETCAPAYQHDGVTIYQGHVLAVLPQLETGSVHCCVTSPPYWGLRDYGTEWQIGLERTPDEYIAKMVDVFREVKRVLRSDGVLFLNMGDSYAAGGNGGHQTGEYFHGHTRREGDMAGIKKLPPPGLKPKDLVGMPWRLAFALQADGWYLRSDIIWCLSGGTWLYARTQKGDMPIMLRDVARLRAETVKLWNGEQWTQVLGWGRSKRLGTEVEIVLRSGERISCSSNHRWPTLRGLVSAGDLKVGDVIDQAEQFPEPSKPLDTDTINEDVAWFVGLYIAEGSRSGDTIQIAGHAKERERLKRLQRLAAEWGGSATFDVEANKQSIRLYGKLLNALIDQFVSGRTAKDKGLAPACWRYSSAWLRSLLAGYLSGDGAWDRGNKRWRLGFCRNYNLERDLRSVAARLGCRLVLKPTTVFYKGKRRPIFRGELRFEWGGHGNCKPTSEILDIRKSRCRELYDVGVADDPHTFALASGVLSHNSKPNPMPESVTDRPTKSHEYLFLLTKAEHYYYDAEAIKEPVSGEAHGRGDGVNPKAIGRPLAPRDRWDTKDYLIPGQKPQKRASRNKQNESFSGAVNEIVFSRNKRTVWTVPTEPFPEAHFATFPQELIKPCILAGCPDKCCAKCGAPWERITELTRSFQGWRTDTAVERDDKHGPARLQGGGETFDVRRGPVVHSTTLGWQPTCACFFQGELTPQEKLHIAQQKGWLRPGVVLDPFFGSGTTGQVARQNGCYAIGIELNAEYIEIAARRLSQATLNFVTPEAESGPEPAAQEKLFA